MILRVMTTGVAFQALEQHKNVLVAIKIKIRCTQLSKCQVKFVPELEIHTFRNATTHTSVNDECERNCKPMEEEPEEDEEEYDVEDYVGLRTATPRSNRVDCNREKKCEDYKQLVSDI